MRQRDPILPVDLLARPLFSLSVAGFFTGFVATMLLLVSTPFRLQHELHFTTAQVGAALAPWPLSMMIVAPLSGWLSDRVTPALLGGIGMLISIVTLPMLAFLPANPRYIDIAWRMALCGLGFSLLLMPIARLIIRSAPRHRAAAAGSLVSMTRTFGQTIGATLVAALLALGAGYGRLPVLLATGLALVAGLCIVVRRTGTHLLPQTPIPEPLAGGSLE